MPSTKMQNPKAIFFFNDGKKDNKQDLAINII